MPASGLERRFGGVRRLYGEAATRFMGAHVCVVGVGGVGSWVVEGLARNGIGILTLIDLDMVAESNTNRQIQALGAEYGKAKVDVLAARARAIHPAIEVRVIEDFVTPENVAALLPPNALPRPLVIDAIDQTRAKAALIAHCRDNGLPIVTTGAAGGKKDPTLIRRADLAFCAHDPLLAKVRALLRREYGFPHAASPKAPEKFGVTALYSSESVQRPVAGCALGDAPQGLSCAGYGSSVCVTASMGFAACAAALEMIGEREADS
ncbi:MAG: tRNA threonylcarbamoyladenosine dehydratase [Zoogloeaceae bacterium]|jgi:tRNA A37 threonylcarbamoyladenosine dehydratase|nr:tRNA threonylcarbamoyladenosine dehydratase [Zoogloeaceae bacterium]